MVQIRTSYLLLNDPTNPKVNNFCTIVCVKHNILRLEVTMYKATVMEVLEAAQNVCHNAQDFLLRKEFLFNFCLLPDTIGQGAIWNVFQHEIPTKVALKETVIMHQTWMMEARQDMVFTLDCGVDEIIICERHTFYDKFFTRLVAFLAQIDFAEGAIAEFGQDLNFTRPVSRHLLKLLMIGTVMENGNVHHHTCLQLVTSKLWILLFFYFWNVTIVFGQKLKLSTESGKIDNKKFGKLVPHNFF